MANPNTLVDVSEGKSVSNNSPQSPTESSITLDFDPLSFRFKEDSPLTSPSDNNREIGDMLSPSQNPNLVFFDPFCTVKEESPTDPYDPNVLLGHTSDPMVDTLTEQSQRYSNGFSDFEATETMILNESCQDDMIQNYSSDDKIIDLSESIDDGKMDDLPESVENSKIDDLLGSVDSGQTDDLPESVDRLDDPVDKLEYSVDRLDETADTLIDTADELDGLADRYDGVIDQSDEAIDRSEDSVDRSSNAVDRADEILADYYPNSEHSPLPSSKSEITGDDLITELEQSHSEETCVSPVTEHVFDDNKHDSSEHDQTLEDDVSYLTLSCFLFYH